MTVEDINEVSVVTVAGLADGRLLEQLDKDSVDAWRET